MGSPGFSSCKTQFTAPPYILPWGKAAFGSLTPCGNADLSRGAAAVEDVYLRLGKLIPRGSPALDTSPIPMGVISSDVVILMWITACFHLTWISSVCHGQAWSVLPAGAGINSGIKVGCALRLAFLE